MPGFGLVTNGSNMITAHSEYGIIKSIFIKRMRDAFKSDEYLESQWEAHNYLGKPNFDKCVQEYEYLEDRIAAKSAQVLFFPESENTTIDSIYCRDAAICTDEGMILCRMGKQERSKEPHEQKKAYEDATFAILGEIQSPGTLEGGDVAWLDRDTLAVGHTYRTNAEGIRQLKKMLSYIGVEVVVAEMPHYKGPSDVFHLMSVFSPVDKNLAVVYSPLMPIPFRKELINRGYDLVEVPDAEFDSMGCNVLALGPRDCIMVKGNPITKKRLEDAGATVQEYEGAEISIKGGGGPTCLTRPVLREI